MQLPMLVLTLAAKTFAFPVNDEPHLFIRIQGPGGAGSFAEEVSKTKVKFEKDGKISEEPAYPHRPPFLAFKEIGIVRAKPPASPHYFPSAEKSKVLPSVKEVAPINDES